MPGFVSHSVFDVHSYQKVAVITSFDTSGHIRPLYVRIGTESFQILSSHLESTFGPHLTYQCKIADGEFERTLRLTYHTKEFAWSIPK